MTLFLQRLAERALGRRVGARSLRIPYSPYSPVMAEHTATFPTSEGVARRGQEHPLVATSQILGAPPEGAADAVSPWPGQTLAGEDRPTTETAGEKVLAANSLATSKRTSSQRPPFDERFPPSASSTAPALFSESILAKDTDQPRSGENGLPGGSASRHSQYRALQNYAGVHETTIQGEQSPLPPAESQNSWRQDLGIGVDEESPSRLVEDRPLPIGQREEKSTDQRVANLRDLPDEITPLLPLSRPAQDTVQSTASLPGSYSTAGEEKTEIHITIGRIEVSALSPHEVERPTKQVARRRLPMSLDEYLVKRHGRAS